MLRSFFRTSFIALVAIPALSSAASAQSSASSVEKSIIDKTMMEQALKSAPKLPNSLAGQLPSASEIENIMADMPDLNLLMGGMMEMMSDPKMQSTMKRAGKTLEQKMQSSGAMKTQANGLPDMNAAMGAMLSMLSDEETMGSMMEMVGGMAEMLEEHVPEAKGQRK